MVTGEEVDVGVGMRVPVNRGFGRVMISLEPFLSGRQELVFTDAE